MTFVEVDKSTAVMDENIRYLQNTHWSKEKDMILKTYFQMVRKSKTHIVT